MILYQDDAKLLSIPYFKWLIGYLILMFMATVPWIEWNIPIRLYPPDARRFICIAFLISALLMPGIRPSISNLTKRRFWNLCFFILFTYFSLLFLSALLQTFAFRFNLFDVGIFHQAIHGMLESGTFYTSISGAGDHLRDHFSPSFILLVPFFWMTHSAPWSLPVAHLIIMSLGVAAWIRLASKIGEVDSFTRHLVLGVTLFICFFDSMGANFWWGFHETSIAFAAWSWFLVLFYTSKPTWIREFILIGLLIIGAGSKETALIEGAGLSVVACVFYIRDRRYLRAVLWTCWAIALVSILLWFESLPKPADKNYFIRYYGYLGRSPMEALSSLVKDPMRPFQVIGLEQSLNFIWQLFGPWIGLPILSLFVSKRNIKILALWFFAFLPSVGLLFLSSNPSLRDAKFHYMLSIWPVCAFLTILVLAEFRKPTLVWIWVLAAILTQGKDVWMNSRNAFIDLKKYGFDDSAFKNLSPNLKIAADERAGVWIANEHQVVRWAELDFFNGQCPDVLLIHREHFNDYLNHSCLKSGSIAAREEFGPWTRLWLSEILAK